MGRVPFPQGRPQAQLEPLSILFWGSLYLAPSYSTKPPSNSDRWVRRPQKKMYMETLVRPGSTVRMEGVKMFLIWDSLLSQNCLVWENF